MTILVVGATGVLGSAAVRQLRSWGYPVRGLTRRPTGKARIESLGAEAVVGDLTDRASLLRAADGVERVLAAAHGMLGRGAQRSQAVDDQGHRNLVDACRRAGVARFVYTSALGAAPDHPVDFMRTKWTIEQVVEASGLDYVILRPSAFMEWHAHRFNGQALLERGRTVLLGDATKSRNFVSATDVAAIACHALVDRAPSLRRIDIAGPGNYTNDDVARLYATQAGVATRVVHVPRGVLRWLGRVVAPLHPGAARVMRIASLPASAFVESFEGIRATGGYPVELTPLESFVRDRVAEWRATASG